ncbi:carboxypeptidase Z isoform X2 [Erinaceus europaeus]|uniref:Carboxypeptidase Z isoform X2 n=1 Tax=Erinaceus europaeus TaxID=9365 RepID=A0ABM3X6V5_ERIEU|nr:carboxypeptidase Z isoform X2 [Erinaceus europaeus]
MPPPSPLLLLMLLAAATSPGCEPGQDPVACEDLRLQTCADAPYGQTAFPTPLGHRSRRALEDSVEYVLLGVLPQLLGGQCDPDLRLLGCAVLAPPCEAGRRLRPCRHVCQALRATCRPALDAIGMAWPYFLDCGDHFAAAAEGCFDPLERLRGDLEEDEPPPSGLPPTFLHFAHHSHAQMVRLLRRTAARCPQVARTYSIGRSFHGRDLLVIEFSDRPGQHELMEPEVKLVGNMHGNEVAGRELLLLLAQFLCSQHLLGSRRVGRLLNSTRLHLLPSLNPDGYEVAAAEGPGYNSWTSGRQNAQSLDLNRNFPDLTSEYYRLVGAGGRSSDHIPIPQDYWAGQVAPETRAVMKWLDSVPFLLSASLHGGDLVVSYPFDFSQHPGEERAFSPTPDEKMFKLLARAYADVHPAMMERSEHRCGGSFLSRGSVINGADWYSFTGGMSDFNYLHSNCFEVTVELGCVKFPPEEALYPLWLQNKEPLLSFLEAAHRGIKGMVVDPSGKPVKDARILVKGIRHDVTTAPGGDYWRLLPPGSHIVMAQAPGYSRVVKKVTIPARMRTAGRVDFVLQPRGAWGGGRGPPGDAQDQRSRGPEGGAKPWWWRYFAALGGHQPRWLLP